MAGTRLLIQGTFVVEFFLLVVAALYFGLFRTKDPISFHLPLYQGGRALLRETLRELEQDESEIAVPLLKIATAKEYAPFLEELKQRQEVQISIDVVEDDSACRVAATKDANEDFSDNKQYSIWVCPSAIKQQHQSPNVFLHKGATYVYPGTKEEVKPLLEQLLIAAPSQNSGRYHERRKPLTISLTMEHREDWDSWAEALSGWIQTEQKALESWPCIRGDIQTRIVLSTLVDAASRGNPRRIRTQSMKKSVVDVQADPSSWNVILYVPRVSPAQFVDPSGGTSKAMYVDNTLVTTIDQPEQRIEEEMIPTLDEDGNEIVTVKRTAIPVLLEELVAQAMAPVSEFLLHQCLGVSNEDAAMNSDTSLPLWQLEAWLQLALEETYQQTRTEIQQEGEWLLQSSTWVVIDDRVAAHWQTLREWMLEAKQLASNNDNQGYGHYLAALALLEDALEYLQAVRTDPTLMEPLRFSLPQFLAIFAPLCLPLFLPHLIGLIREYKRYKKLRDQSKKSD